MSNKRTHWNRIAKAVEKKHGVIIHEKCQGYGCDECVGVGMWPESVNSLVVHAGAWLNKVMDQQFAKEREWDHIQRMLHQRIDAMNARLEAACDYLHVPHKDEPRPKTKLP